MAPQPIEAKPITPEQLAKAAEGQRTAEHVVKTLQAASADIIAPLTSNVASALSALNDHSKQIMGRLNRVAGSRLSQANKRGSTIAAALTGPVQASLDTVAQNSAELYASVPEYSYHPGGPPENPSQAPAPIQSGSGATIGRAVGRGGGVSSTRGNGSSSSPSLTRPPPLPQPAIPAPAPPPQPKEWYCVIQDSTGCAVTVTDNPALIGIGFTASGPYPDPVTASQACPPCGGTPLQPPPLSPPSPPSPVSPPPCPAPYTIWYPGEFTILNLGGEVTPQFCTVPGVGTGNLQGDGTCITFNPQPADCLPSPPPPPPGQPPPSAQPPPSVQPPPSIGPPTVTPPAPPTPPPEPIPPPTEDCQPCDIWAINAQNQNLVNVVASATASISADIRRLCHCITHAARLLCQCFGKPLPGTSPGTNGAELDMPSPGEWTDPDTWIPDEDETDAPIDPGNRLQDDVQILLPPFAAEQGGAVGGSTVGIDVQGAGPAQFGD